MQIRYKRFMVIGISTSIILCIVLYLFFDEDSSTEILTDVVGKSVSEKEVGDEEVTVNKEEQESFKSKKTSYQEYEITGKANVTTKHQAEKIISNQKRALGLGEDDSLVIKNKSSDRHNNDYYHLQQTYKGIPVFDAKMVLEVENTQAVILSGNLETQIDMSVIPKYTANKATEMAIKNLGGTSAVTFTLIQPELIIYRTEDKNILAWHSSIQYNNSTNEPEIMIVDANQPQILSRHSLILR